MDVSVSRRHRPRGAAAAAAKQFKMPKKSVLEQVKLIRHAQPDVVEKRQRNYEFRRQQLEAEAAANYAREYSNLMAHQRKIAPHAQAADIRLRAGQLFKRYHGFDFAP